MTERTIVVLEGDQTGQEMLEEALRVLDPNVIRVPLNFVRFDQDFNVKAVIAEAPHSTAPSLYKKNIANPLAMILAGAALLSCVGSRDAERASRAIYESALEAIYDGVATSDLGGSASTSDFTDEVINRVTRKLEVWGTLG